MRSLLVGIVALALAACVAPAPARPSPTGATTSPAATGAQASPASAPSAWRRIADIPTARSEVAAAVFRREVYVIGGFGGGRVVEIFDGQRWRRGPDLPIAVDHPMAASIEDLPTAGSDAIAGVYVLGGNAGGPTARAFRLAPGATAWRERAAMPAPRSQAAAVSIGATVYVVGGYDGARLAAPTFAYDVAGDRWREVAAIPTPRDHLAAAALGGRVCAVGGRRLSLTTNLPTLECYDPSTDRWERMPDAPTARGGVGAATVGDRLVFVGGEQPLGTFKEVEAYDAQARRWSKLADLPSPRHGIGVVAVGSTVYVMTGGPTPGGSQTAVCEALDLR